MIYNLYTKEVDKANDKNELLQNLFEQTQLVNKIINERGNSNEIFNKIIYDYCLLLVQEGLNIEASRYLINIKDSGDEHIQELYERLYFNCELELGNTLPRPNPRLNMILSKNPKKEKSNMYRNMPPNKEINNIPNRFDKNRPHLGGERPQNPPQANPMPRPHPQFNNPNPPKPIPKRGPTQNPPYPNVPPQAEKPQTTQNLPQSQPQNFNFGGTNTHITRPPNIKPPMIRPVRPGENITNPPRFNQKNIGNMNNMNHINNNNIKNVTNNINYPPTTNPPKEVQFGKKINEPTPKEVNEIKSEPMTPDEEMLHNYFSNSIETYNSVYKDENKRRDFANKVNVLLKKLENHELKNSLIKYLQDFINLKAKKDNNGMRKLYMRIQSVDWDKNKNWMPLLEKIMNMRD
jgi:hypothetical protein